MINWSIRLKVGTRNSKLALIQTKNTLSKMSELIPELIFDIIPFSSPGDRDLSTDLRSSPIDFFTKDLDEAIRDGVIDFAIHSAKDLPDQIPDYLDFCWLPWKEDPRDVIILQNGMTFKDLPETPVIGVSSDRRQEFCSRRFPGAQLKSIRGTIEKRLEQLDSGNYDLLIMAAAALHRLGFSNRINEYIAIDDLVVPDGQGVLAMTFKKGDKKLSIFRSLFVKSVVFAGAGCGKNSLTLEVARALSTAEVCLFDALMDPAILNFLPSTAVQIDVGKRCGTHKSNQNEINSLLLKYSCRGHKVVRLKGGDPGIFGHLAEEVDTLSDYDIPFRVLPGISSFQAASTKTGMLLTRRKLSRGFTILTPRQEGSSIADVTSATRISLPLVLYMSIKCAEEIVRQLISEGLSEDTPAAVVYNAGYTDQQTIRTTLVNLNSDICSTNIDKPGILFIGEVTCFSYRSSGALNNMRILVTASESLLEKAITRIENFGGQPIPCSLISIVPERSSLESLLLLKNYDWVILTSPSSVNATLTLLKENNIDIRTLPKIMVSGSGTALECKKYGIIADAIPDKDFGVKGMVTSAQNIFKKDDKILRLRSDVAGEDLSTQLKQLGFTIDDVVVCTNTALHKEIPDFDAVFFASSSAVKAFYKLDTKKNLQNKMVLAIGKPTLSELTEHGVQDIIVGTEADVESAVLAIAITSVKKQLTEVADLQGVISNV